MNIILENIFTGRELYKSMLTPTCNKHKLSQSEMIILLFLSTYPDLNTATEIVKKRRMTKSSVSMSLRNLEERGFVSSEFINGNHRTVYLRINDAGQEIIDEAIKAQNKYFSILTDGFSQDELENLRGYFERMSDNIRDYNSTKIF